MPAVTWAGIKIDNRIELDHGLTLKVFALILASICGGVSSLFVETSFDKNMKYPNLAKVFIGSCLGTCSGLLFVDQLQFGIFSIVLPTFIIASLGAPLMVFYLMWLSNPETQAEIKEQIKQKVREKLNLGDGK